MSEAGGGRGALECYLFAGGGELTKGYKKAVEASRKVWGKVARASSKNPTSLGEQNLKASVALGRHGHSILSAMGVIICPFVDMRAGISMTVVLFLGWDVRLLFLDGDARWWF